MKLKLIKEDQDESIGELVKKIGSKVGSKVTEDESNKTALKTTAAIGGGLMAMKALSRRKQQYN